MTGAAFLLLALALVAAVGDWIAVERGPKAARVRVQAADAGAAASATALALDPADDGGAHLVRGRARCCASSATCS